MHGAKIELAFRALNLLIELLDKLMPAIEEEVASYRTGNGNVKTDKEDVKLN